MQAVFIKRALTSLLENALKHRRCIFITGPLGAGKTSLLKTLYPKESFVNLDCCFVRLDAFDSATDLLYKSLRSQNPILHVNNIFDSTTHHPLII